MPTYRGAYIEGENPKRVVDDYGDVCYMYRGFEIERDDDTRAGDYGRYRCRIARGTRWYNALTEALQEIDAYIRVKENMEANTLDNQDTSILSELNVPALYPVKYNGVSNYGDPVNNYALVIDWLSVHFHVKDLSIFSNTSDASLNIGSVTLVLQDFQSRHFRTIYRISVDGYDFGFLSLNPSSTVSYSEYSCSLKITNSRFYDNEWYSLVSKLQNDLCLEFRNVTRVDIALDTTCTRLLNIVDTYFHSPDGGKTEDIKYLGRSSIQMFGRNVKGRVYKNFKLGVPRSANSKINRTFTIYNKTHELETSGKDYISNFHDKNGITGGDVYRHELRLQSTFLRKLNSSLIDLTTAEVLGPTPITLKQLSSPQFLFSLYVYSLGKFVEFTTHSGPKNVTSRPRYDLFTFDLVPCDDLLFVRVPPCNSSPDQTAKCTVKFLVNELFTSPVNSNGDYEISSICGALVDIISRYDLGRWFQKKFSVWELEIDTHIDFYRVYHGSCYRVFKRWFNNFASEKSNVYAL